MLSLADVCFKVKTTAPRRYYVRPNAARLRANSSDQVEGEPSPVPRRGHSRDARRSISALLLLTVALTHTRAHKPSLLPRPCAVVLQPQSTLPPPDERKDKFLVQVRTAQHSPGRPARYRRTRPAVR